MHSWTASPSVNGFFYWPKIQATLEEHLSAYREARWSYFSLLSPGNSCSCLLSIYRSLVILSVTRFSPLSSVCVQSHNWLLLSQSNHMGWLNSHVIGQWIFWYAKVYKGGASQNSKYSNDLLTIGSGTYRTASGSGLVPRSTCLKWQQEKRASRPQIAVFSFIQRKMFEDVNIGSGKYQWNIFLQFSYTSVLCWKPVVHSRLHSWANLSYFGYL